jgi:hypothetical protein
MLKYIIMGVICCLALEANATTVLLSDYKAPKNEEFRAFNELYLTGVMEGLLTFNASWRQMANLSCFAYRQKRR